MPTSNVEVFLKIKQVLRLHPDWDDEQVALAAGVKGAEMHLIGTARREVERGV